MGAFVSALSWPPGDGRFFERDKFEEVLKHLPEHVKPVARFAYVTGWRTAFVPLDRVALANQSGGKAGRAHSRCVQLTAHYEI